MEMKKASKIIINLKYIIIVTLSFLIAGGISMFFFYSGTQWYNNINKPFIAPSSMVNMIVWLILYCIIGVSAYIALNTNYCAQRDTTLRLFLLDIAMLIIWSFLFYFKNDTWSSFVDIMLLMYCTFNLIKSEYLISPKAAWMMMPYFMWTGIMTVINYNIVMIN